MHINPTFMYIGRHLLYESYIHKLWNSLLRHDTNGVWKINVKCMLNVCYLYCIIYCFISLYYNLQRYLQKYVFYVWYNTVPEMKQKINFLCIRVSLSKHIVKHRVSSYPSNYFGVECLPLIERCDWLSGANIICCRRDRWMNWERILSWYSSVASACFLTSFGTLCLWLNSRLQ